jgi:hypothetical protein
MQDSALVDGAGQKPTYSLRTFCRMLAYMAANTPRYGLHRAALDGACMAFVTQLAPDSAPRVEDLARRLLLPPGQDVQVRALWFAAAQVGVMALLGWMGHGHKHGQVKSWTKHEVMATHGVCQQRSMKSV